MGHHLHKYRKQVINRLARIEGHVRAIKEMAQDDRDCSDLLIQIAAVQKALDGVAKVILKDHLEVCVAAAGHEDDLNKVLGDLRNALDHYIR
ncbi:cytosolic protein [Kyrpidia spormannii]|uniref:Cytosolic protein n=1 Tax=Kyrpidia spormannii TaxID=2055160 RepID=A0A2K8N367_9BACL|nr:metal-sensing transcriptional repressor [Kyrpidia spormannii]ATY83906.1 cytosolic protein [Kyrpidia spormannii]